MPGRHAPDRFARAQKAADDIDIEDAPPALRRHIDKVALLLEDTGIVNQTVETAEFAVDGAIHRLYLGFLGDVGLEQDGLVAARGQ